MTAHLKTNAPFRILILGGGVSGLSAAHTILSSAKNRNVSVTLLESTPRFGGWVNTKTLSDGCVFELGPRTIRPVGIPGRRTLALVNILLYLFFNRVDKSLLEPEESTKYREPIYFKCCTNTILMKYQLRLTQF